MTGSGVLAILALALPLRAEPMSERQKLIHTLGRLTFGPRPGDVERLGRQGIDAFIAEQLRPESIPDSLDEKKLSAYRTLALSPEELSRLFPLARAGAVLSDEALYSQESPHFELAKAKIIRAVYGERQLQEVMLDFWFNHFNVYPLKDSYKVRGEWYLPSYEREVLRPRVFGKFRDLLGAVAHSPAMLIYLDNYLSSVDERHMPFASASGAAAPDGVHPSVNENYSRELLELHTVGLGGGYAQKDVVEVAKILSGWTVAPPDEKGGTATSFRFQADMHVPGEKTVMGRTFAFSGQDEGERLLDFLARHPATARYISLKLCRRFVDDDPPEGLVRRVAAKFLESDGDIRETLLALFHSPEFYDRRYFRSKIKSPFEFITSVLRAVGAKVQDPAPLVALLSEDEPPYLCVPPNGYPDRGGHWINAGSMTHRFDLARALLMSGRSGKMPEINPTRLIPAVGRDDGAGAMEGLLSALLSGEIQPGAKAALFEQLDDSGVLSTSGGRRDYNFNAVAMLIVASPDFQTR